MAVGDIGVGDVLAVAPELSSIADDAMANIVLYVNESPDGTAFGDTATDITTRMARLYLAAHIGKMTLMGKSGQAGPVTSEAAGALRRSYAHMMFENVYMLTPYGCLYWQMVKDLAGPRVGLAVSDVYYTTKGLDAILAKLANAAALELRVGFVGEKAQEISSGGRLTIAEVAAINEYGNAHVPRREPIQSTLRNRESEIRNELAKAYAKVFTGRSVDEALHVAGQAIARMIQQTINELPQDNAESTARRKGFNAPLIDSGELIRAVSAVVVRSGGSADGEEGFEITTESA